MRNLQLLCSLCLCSSAVLADESSRHVTLSLVTATAAIEKLNAEAAPAELLETIAKLEAAGELKAITRLKFATLEEVESQLQFGATEFIVTGRNLGPAGGRNPGFPAGVPSYSQEQTGTLLRTTVRVREHDVLATVSFEQTYFEHAKVTEGEAGFTPPPPKSVSTLQTTVAIPAGPPVLVGVFDSTARSAGQRTIFLVSAVVSPIAAK